MISVPARALVAAMGLAIVPWPAAAAAEVDPGWPREINVPEARILVYQPQIETLEGNLLKGRGALSVTPAGKKEPIFGAVWYEARIEVDRDARIVTFPDIRIPRVRFPGADAETAAKLGAIIEREVPRWELAMSLDRMIAAVDAAKGERGETDRLKMDPPRIHFETRPAVLVLIDGEPRQARVEGTTVERVLNTPAFLVWDTGSKSYWLNGAGIWFQAPDTQGEWKQSSKPPRDVAAIHDKARAGDPDAAADGGENEKKDKKRAAEVPMIIVSTVPAELIVSEGEPKFVPVTGVDLLYMSNSPNDVLVDLEGQKHYVLLAGRWYRAKMMQGPWEFVPPETLPPAFAKIPPKADIGRVLPSVPGTPQAEEAVMDAAVPQTAAVKRGAAQLDVSYDGDPKFQAIPNTQVEYALNTASQVLRIKGKYYACDQAVWYVADGAKGPWMVADSVPKEVQEIPPESPVYNVKYVYIYDTTPEVVYVGYLPPYVGCYPYHGTVVWGTGWHHPGWYGAVYYPRPVTFGFHATYNPYTGWNFGMSVGFGWGPFTFTVGGWSQPYWWGPVGYPPHYHRPPGYYPGHPPGHGGVPPGGRQPRPLPAGTNGNIYNRPANEGRVANTRDKAARPTPPVARGAKNDVLADRDGNVYRHGKDGFEARGASGWEKPAAGGASGRPSAPAPSTPGPSARPSTPSPPSRPSSGSLDSDWAARQRGNQRVQGYQHGGGAGRAPAARPGGGPRRR